MTEPTNVHDEAVAREAAENRPFLPAKPIRTVPLVDKDGNPAAEAVCEVPGTLGVPVIKPSPPALAAEQVLTAPELAQRVARKSLHAHQRPWDPETGPHRSQYQLSTKTNGPDLVYKDGHTETVSEDVPSTLGQPPSVESVEVKEIGGASRQVPILPPGVAPLQAASLQAHADSAIAVVIARLENGDVLYNDIMALLKAIPRDIMRRLVYEYAGMGSSLLMTLNKQVQLVDTVLSQLVASDGTLKPRPEGISIDLKDAMNLSIKCSQLILRDLPKVYNIERIQKLEMAMGEVMEKHLSAEQQAEVLKRLEELTTDKQK